MVFSSLFFLFFFFPVVLLLHYVVPKNCKNVVLLLGSLFFYGWGEPLYVVLMIFSAVFHYVMGLDIERRDQPAARKWCLVFAILVNLALLGFFKYYGFFIDTLNHVFSIQLPVRQLALPIGISFYTFQAMSYLIDVYWGKVRAQKNLLHFAVYLTMFPQLVAGPIVKYTDIQEQLVNRRMSGMQLGKGTERLVFGLAKKVLLANNLGLLHTGIQEMSERSLLAAWIGMVAYTLQIYFDFSGYSDMAIGMGHMFGFSYPENFDYPYSSKSVSEFWRRWHMTLSHWFRDYVYIPLGGSRKGVWRQIRNILVVWMLTGLWHGASWNFVLWGLYYGCLLLLEKFFLSRWLGKLPSLLQRIYTLVLVMFGWIIFCNTDLQEMGIYLKNLVGIGTSGWLDGQSLYVLKENILLLLLSVLCCMPSLKQWWKQHIRVRVMISVPIVLGLFLLSTAYLVYGSYNPFLYFRF